MRFTSSAPVAGDAGRAFDALVAPGGIARLLPGAGEPGAAGNPDAAADSAAVAVCVGNLTAHYHLRWALLDADPGARVARLRIRGAEQDSLGDVDGVITLRVAPDAGAGAMLHLAADLDIRGQVARFGSAPWQEVLDRITARAGRALGEVPRVHPSAPDPAAWAAPPASAAPPAPAAWAAPTRDAARSPEHSGRRPRGRALRYGVAVTLAGALAVAAVIRIRSTRKGR